jgi:TBC1 domain family member 8/9
LQVVQLNSLRPTNDAFCANLRTRLKASLPLMKALKPFSHTFFSEWYLSPDRDLDGEAAAAKKQQDEKVGELISFDDEKGKGKEEEARGLYDGGRYGKWVPRRTVRLCFSLGDVGRELTSALPIRSGLIFKFPGDPRK